MEQNHPMDYGYPTELSIMNEAKDRVLAFHPEYCGTSVDLYHFSRLDPNDCWNQGNIFHANNMGDLSFGDSIEVSNGSNKRDAMFKVLESNNQEDVQGMLERSLNLKHVGILEHCFVGYNRQISKFVSGFSVPTCTLADWLKTKDPEPASTAIPTEVQELLRTGYLALEAIWENGSTSECLDNPSSYHMINNPIKINPLCLRAKNEEDKKLELRDNYQIKINPLCLRAKNENDKKLELREAFSNMILNHIYPVWSDVELEDFIDLLRNKHATKTSDILGAPVFLSPATREIMYHSYDLVNLKPKQCKWLEENADLGDWKTTASNADPTLKILINSQDFSLDFLGALHFARVVTAHYRQLFKGQWVKDQVDTLLRQQLPRLLSRRYNVQYVKDSAAE